MREAATALMLLDVDWYRRFIMKHTYMDDYQVLVELHKGRLLLSEVIPQHATESKQWLEAQGIALDH